MLYLYVWGCKTFLTKWHGLFVLNARGHCFLLHIKIILSFLFSRLNIGKNDLLTFYDGDDLTAKVLGSYGGSKSRFKLYTSTADVTIQFQSDPATNVYGYGNGFVVHFFGETQV